MTNKTATRRRLPILAALITGVCIVAAETLIMFVIHERSTFAPWVEIALDSTTLLLLVSPALYLLIYRPQARYLVDLQRTAMALSTAKEELEHRVLERTRELQAANAQLDETVARLQAQNREVKALADMVEVIQSCRTKQEVYAAVERYLQPLFPHASGTVFVRRDAADTFDAVASWGAPRAPCRSFAADDCWALRRRRPHIDTDNNATIRCAHLDGPPARASICIPMVAQGVTLGVLSLLPGGAAGAPLQAAGDPPQAPTLATSAAESIGLALANLALRETLHHQATRDPLTDLFNRRYLEEIQARELDRAKRHGSSVAIAVIDIDHFKRFNDTLGHDAGDVLLRELASALRSSVRTEDIACRIGGEEFALLMPDTALDAALRRMDELRDTIGALAVAYRGKQLGMVTISIGVACCPAHGASLEELLRAADEALYRAKAQGRNRVAAAKASKTANAVTPSA